ncbi:cell division protein ZapA [Oscillospiraceae bacterium OttesenSCG-928-G22]|nr:cell division protein ZapA [Oscillospiraceae bacterium OttesenSCG-928-G22]
MERITVTISDMEFTLLSEESRDYVEKVAKLVDEKMLAVGGGEGMSTLNAAILAAVNLADEYYKSVDSAENLRVQLKEYFDETSKLKNELSELRREMAKIKGVK